MSTPVVMPQMGESIAEGTIVRWIKKVGDAVDRDEPLFEISTDKVDAEIPSPAAGVLIEIAVKEGETVPSTASSRRSARPAKSVAGTAPAARSPSRTAPHRRSRCSRAAGTRRTGRSLPQPRPQHLRHLSHPTTPTSDAPEVVAARPPHREGAQRRHRPDPGSGIGGRVTKQDILGFIETRRGVARRGSAAPRPRAAGARRSMQPGEPVDSRADVGDAQEDRRAHGAQPAHLGARLLGVRGELLARRSDSQGEEGRVRARGREADLHVVHRQGRGRLPARATR